MIAVVQTSTLQSMGERAYSGTIDADRHFTARATPPFDYVYVLVTHNSRSDQTPRSATPGERHAVTRALLQHELQRRVSDPYDVRLFKRFLHHARTEGPDRIKVVTIESDHPNAAEALEIYLVTVHAKEKR